jgi:hypothetical protein
MFVIVGNCFVYFIKQFYEDKPENPVRESEKNRTFVFGEISFFNNRITLQSNLVIMESKFPECDEQQRRSVKIFINNKRMEVL